MLVEDAYYLDAKSRELLRENNIPYLSAISPVRFSEVWRECEKYVKEKGDWVIMYNETTKEHAMMCWDPVREKKFYILTNAFRNRNKVGSKPINTIWETYSLLFNATDRFNHYLANMYWPYARWGWQSNYDDLFFAAIMMNIYVQFCEVRKIEKPVGCREFLVQIADVLFSLSSL